MTNKTRQILEDAAGITILAATLFLLMSL